MANPNAYKTRIALAIGGKAESSKTFRLMERLQSLKQFTIFLFYKGEFPLLCKV